MKVVLNFENVDLKEIYLCIYEFFGVRIDIFYYNTFPKFSTKYQPSVGRIISFENKMYTVIIGAT